MNNRLECVDAGSEYCPCYLAETNDCITCSILMGKDFCDCNWRGTCIYQEYVWNGNKKKASRKFTSSKIINKKLLGNDVYLLKIKTSKTLARQLKEPGAYIFIRGEGLPQYFDAPMSVMDSDDKEGYVYIAYEVKGSKTKKLADSEKILVRGPYWNGIYGLKNLKKLKNKNCLLLARGVAQAPTLLIIKKLIKNLNNITLLIDEGKVDNYFLLDFIKEFKINIIKCNLMDDKSNELIKNIIEENNIDFIFSGGSDILHRKVIDIIDSTKSEILLSITNNSEICCGEGVCGACSTFLKDGVSVKRCKTQLDIKSLIERRSYID